MKLSKIFQKVAERLPGGLRLRLIREYLGLLGENPYYRNLLRLNLRSFFCIQPHHGPIRYRKATTVPPLYHITEKDNLSSIQKSGLCNPVTRAVFLIDSPAGAFSFGAYKHLSQPVLLKVDSHRMLADGYCFFYDLTPKGFWIVEHVPAEYISFTE